MQRWRPLHIAILSLGTIASSWTTEAAAADPPPLCPSQVTTPPAEAPSAQSVTGSKERKPEAKDSAIDIHSDKGTFDADGNASLQGHVAVRQGDRQINAEEIQYNSKTNALKTDKSLQYEDPEVKITGNGGGDYSPSAGANFRSATFELRQRAARGSADTLQVTPQGGIDLQGVRFTTCPANEVAWQISAKSIILDTTARVGEARSATVNFEGVPILYLPWFSFPLSNERKSGFLYPTIGNNSRSGVSFSVPYYWNIAPNADLTFEPVEYSRRGPDLGGETRFLSSEDRGTLKWNFLPYDNVFNSQRGRVQLVNTLELPGEYRFAVNAENVSDTHYYEDFAQGPEGTSTAFVPQRAALTYRDEHWNLDGEIQHYRTTDYTLAEFNRPYAHLPRLALSGDFGWGATEQFHYGFDSEIVKFHRSITPVELVNNQLLDVCNPTALGIGTQLSPCINGWRIDVMPQASLNFEAPGYFVRPGLAWRATQYELDNTLPGENRSPSRTLPIASFDTGLTFERQAGSHEQRTVTLEPRLMYLYVPYRNQDDLPLFDTGLPDLDPVELFRNNRYVGADRMADANQLSVGVTSRLLDARNGRQFLTATVGEIYYFTNPRVVLPPQLLGTELGTALGTELVQTETPRADHRSDLVAQVALTAFEDWNANVGLQWNPQASQTERAEVNLQYKPADQSVINVGYRYQHDVFQQAEVSTAWPVSDAWNIFLRGIYSIQDHKPLERFGGFEYRSCCWKVRLGVRSFVSTRTGSSDIGEYLQLELTGLASVGSESDKFLTTAIRGYVPAESPIQRPKGP